MGLEHTPQTDAGWPDRLDRYYAGAGTAEERAQVETYLAAHPEVVRFFNTLRTELDELPAEAPNLMATLHRIKERQGRANTDEHVRRPPSPLPISTVLRHHRSWRTNLRLVGATVAGATVAGALVVAVGLRAVVIRQDQGASRSQGAVISYTTRPGQRAEIDLGDGTHVALNVASRIDIEEGFGRTSRTVKLEGEAYFRVARSSGAPFVVDWGHARATVLGTEFGVRAYEPRDVQVAVRNGKVALGHAVLIANDVGHVGPDDVMTIASHQDLSAALGFVTGKLVLRDVPLRDAIPDLNRWYGANVRLGDPALGAKPIEAVLPSGSISDLKEALQVIFNARVVQNGRTLTLFARNGA
jgi:ferric-dicitrate binding protein FerR (iron transport regulator)